MATDSAIDTLPKPLSGLHLLLTYECNYACSHCFVWGGPSQTGTMTVETIEQLLAEAEALGTIEWIYFEGGEAFLHYPLLTTGIRLAKELGYKVGSVSNAYWATTDADAMEWLQPAALATPTGQRQMPMPWSGCSLLPVRSMIFPSAVTRITAAMKA